MSQLLRILAAQIEIPETRTAIARDTHLARIAGLIDATLAREPADLVVLPELSSIEYSRAAFDRLDDLAEADDGASWQAFAPVARKRGCTILYGFARRGAKRPRISMGHVGPDGGFKGGYDKLHLCQYGASMEKEYFAPGAGLFLFAVGGLRAAPIVCYDIRIPELSRTLCRTHGARLLLHCGAYFKDESYPTWPDFVTARAMENQVYLLSLNRAGKDFGGSMLCPPWIDARGEIIRFSDRETLTVVTVDPTRIEAVRKAYTFLVDARPSYADLPVHVVSEAAGHKTGR